MGGFFKYKPTKKKAYVLLVTQRLAEFIIIIFLFFLIFFFIGWGGHEIQSGSTFVMYFIISSFLLSVQDARPFIFHMSGFLIFVGPLHWPTSDSKAIKHKTFCKTRATLSLWRPRNASLGNYDNNSAAVRVARALERPGGRG